MARFITAICRVRRLDRGHPAETRPERAFVGSLIQIWPRVELLTPTRPTIEKNGTARA